MKILLIGEYSRLHNSLKEGLQHLGHDVFLVGYGDSFKDYPVDFKFEKKWQSGILRIINSGLYRTTGFEVASLISYLQFRKNKNLFANFDVVQLINENSFYTQPFFEQKMLQFLFDNNKKVFLLSCGDDYINVKYHFENPMVKSVVQPYLQGKIEKSHFQGVLKFRRKSFKKLHTFLYENICGVIATDLDYHLPLIGNPKYLGMIANPVNTEKIAFSPLEISDKINIFLGINHESYYKKGINYFEEALEIIKNKYADKVNITISRSIPYEQYIELYDNAHILLDQAFAKDQGYNALEAMAKGKVVFTGAEIEFTDYYQLEDRVAVNAVPNAEALATELEHLILHPEEIKSIGKNAFAFIKKEHDFIKIAEKYLRIWKLNEFPAKK